MKKPSPLRFAAVVVLTLSSCGVVPLDLDLVKAHERGLSMEGVVGPIDKFGGNDALAGAVFIPDVTTTGGLDAQNGYLVYSSSGSRQLSYVSWNATSSLFHKLSGDIYIGSLSDTYPQVVLHSTKGATRVIKGIQSGNPARLRGATADLSKDVLSETAAVDLQQQNLTLFGLGANPVGFSIAAANDATKDTAYVLAQDPPTHYFFEYSMDFSAAASAGVAALRGIAPYDLSWLLPAWLSSALYYYEPVAARSYACVYDAAGSRWRTYTWTAAAPGSGGELTGIDHRIDALLSTGELLSTEGGTARIYGADGTLLATFDLSDMTFVEERFVGGQARLLFARPIMLDNSPAFILYSTATADVKSLNGT